MHNMKCLIVCFSYSGNTWRIALEIQRQTNGKLCEIYTRQPYPMVYQRLLEQVRREIKSKVKPHLFPIDESVEDYDVIFVGTPNWCGTMAPPLAAFLKQNNMAGKVLFPFYSHCGGGGTVEQDIRSMCPKAQVESGIGILNDGEGELPELIAAWLDTIQEMNRER